VTTGATDTDGAARYRQLPEPAAIPIWCGGSSEAALRRAATVADGWMPLFLTPTEYGDAIDHLAKETVAAGRPPEAVTPSIAMFVSLDDDPVVARRRGTAWMSSLYGIPAKAFERHLVSGTTADVTEAVAAYRAAGCRHVALYVTADQPIDQFEHLTSALRRAGVPA
jgi:alkanesulfonate monooxygenase SsuD/methylene tetrahydromethanopterin reductase-like flavin-dependent oxidoreductase (luciferase family)